MSIILFGFSLPSCLLPKFIVGHLNIAVSLIPLEEFPKQITLKFFRFKANIP